MRVHLMLRNLQGLWACTDPQCAHAPPRSNPCPSGTLHYFPTLIRANAGRGSWNFYTANLVVRSSSVVIVAQPATRNEWYLSPDRPNLEAAPDISSFDRDYERYAVFWPASGNLTPGTPQWTHDGVGRQWRHAGFDVTDGSVGLGLQTASIPGYLYYVPAVHGAKPPAAPKGREGSPGICPRCDADWRGRDVIKSPIRTQRTGFQKVAQVLADTLLRDLAQPPLSTERKLVVFSDSRQDAAKLSAGMRFSHYRDTASASACEFHRSARGWPASLLPTMSGATPLISRPGRGHRLCCFTSK